LVFAETKPGEVSAEKGIAQTIAADHRAMAQLSAVRDLQLPDWCIAAGFVRNRILDARHGHAPRRAPNAVDGLFFDPMDTGRKREAAVQACLLRRMSDTVREVRNQARLHVAKGLPPHLRPSTPVRTRVHGCGGLH